MDKKKIKIKHFIIGILFAIVMGINSIYLLGIGGDYAIEFYELIEYGDIEDFDKYFSRRTKIYYGNEMIRYSDARNNIINYIESGNRLYCNSYGPSDTRLFRIIGESNIRFTTSGKNGGEEHGLTLRYLKKFFSIRILSLRLDTNFDTLYPIFFGENEL